MNRNDFNEYVQKLKEHFNLEDYIGRYRKIEPNHKTLCFFHEETDPSFSIHPKGQYWTCFGCGKRGDLIKFLMLHLNLSFMEVVQMLAEEANFPVPTFSKELEEEIKERKAIEEILTDAANYYHKNLTDEGKKYLIEERDLTEELIAEFMIGYANGELLQYLTGEKGYPFDLCYKSGLIKNVSNRNEDYFNNSITLPNLKNGIAVHMSARSFDGSQPKYLNLPGEINYLYNEDALSNKEVIICEGVIDAITLTKFGYNAVALTTSNFQKKFIPKFSRCETINICLDGDDAGNSGALRAAELIPEKAKLVELPEGFDPNDYFKSHTKEEFDSLLNESEDIVKHLLSKIPADIDKVELPKKLEPILQILSKLDEATASAYIHYVIRERFGLEKRDAKIYDNILESLKKVEANEDEDDLEPKKKIIGSAEFEGLVDLVLSNGMPAFLIKEGDELKITLKHETDDVIYVPPKREKIPWALPDGENILELHKIYRNRPCHELDRELYLELYNHHKSVSELPDDGLYILITLWDFHTYLIDKFPYSPVFAFCAVAERGKSRTGKGMIFVAYRGIRVESLREAYIIRIAKYFKASIFFDVENIWKKAQQSGSEDILLGRFEQGQVVPRVLHPERAPFNDIDYFNIFGATIVASNEPLSKILETRSIEINTEISNKKFENEVIEESLLYLKEKLILFRARHMDDPLPDIEKIATGRIGDLLKPLMQVLEIVCPENKEELNELIDKIIKEKMVERSTTIEAQLLNIVFQHFNAGNNGALDVKVIADNFNKHKEEKFKLTYQRIGRMLSALGFQKGKNSKGSRTIILDENKIIKLKEQYGYEDIMLSTGEKTFTINLDAL